MTGKAILNTTLRVNAAFSLLSGVDMIVFDRSLVEMFAGYDAGSIMPTGVMLIVFSVFVFSVSMLREVNKYLVGAIIAMDVLWVAGSAVLLVAASTSLTAIGIFAVAAVAFIIALFAVLQTVGLRMHLRSA